MVGTLCILGGCASLVEEVRNRISVDGVSYETRTRTYARADGSGFQSTQVIFNGRAYYCDDRGSESCADTVRALVSGHHLNHPGNGRTASAGGGYTPPS